MVKFIDILKAEIYKTKHTWNFTIMLLLPVVITTIMLSYNVKELMNVEVKVAEINPWGNYIKVFLQFYGILYPLLVAIIAFSLSNIEHKNHGFKQLFTFPTSKFNLYFSKVLILLLWIVSSLILAYSLLIISGNILGYMYPQLGFQNFDMNIVVLVYFVKCLITLVSIVAIHFFLSIYWDNFIVSVGSASFLVIFGMIVNNWEYSYIIPYSNHLKAFTAVAKNSKDVFTIEIFWSIGYSILFFIGGYLIMIRKSIND